MKSWYTIRARTSGMEVLIYDEIGAYGVTAKGFLAELGALPDDTAIDLRLNSPGGSVFDAVAIYNALRRHAGEVTVWIDGIAASAASYIAMAGDTIIMPENAFLMIHDPSGLAMGTAEDMRAMADALDKIAGSLVRGYAGKSGKPDDDIAALMAAETWFDATGALELGLIDRIAEPVTLAASFDVTRFRNAPPALVEATDTGDTPAEAETVASDTDADSAEDDAESLADDKTFAAGPAGANAPTPEANSSGAVTDAPSDAATIRAETIAHARAVIDLCRLAGQPRMAGRFLEQDASLDEVRAALLALRSEAEPEIDAHHAQPGRTTTARPWGEIVARTFRLKG